MHMPASSNGEDGRFSVYKSEFDSLCEYQRVGEELWNMRDTRRAFSPHPYSLGWSRHRPQLYPSNSVWSESRTLNPLVMGSNPIWGTNYEDFRTCAAVQLIYELVQLKIARVGSAAELVRIVYFFKKIETS